MIYAKGARALGICDRCGFAYLLNDLKPQFVAQKATNLLVCAGCLDVDHPQLLLGRRKFVDPQVLKNPRPDLYVASLYGWNPVGAPGDTLTASVGTVTVTTS